MLLRSIFQLCINNSSETGGPNGTAQTRLLTNVPLKLRRLVEFKDEKIFNKTSRRAMIRLKAQHSTVQRSSEHYAHGVVRPIADTNVAKPWAVDAHACVHKARPHAPAAVRRSSAGAAGTGDGSGLRAFLESIGVAPPEAERLLATCPGLRAESGYGIGMKCMLLRAQGMLPDDVAVTLARAPTFFMWSDPDMAAACDLLGVDTVLALARAPGLLDPSACGWPLVLLALSTLQAELGLPRPQVVAAMYDWVLRDPPGAHRPVADVCHISKNVRWLRRRAGHDAPERLVRERGRPELFLSDSADTIERFLAAEVSRTAAPRTPPPTPGLPHWL